jgi:acyl carrier protein
MSQDISSELAKILSDILEENVSPDRPEARLIEDYGANSMDVVDIVMRIERTMNIRIPDEDIPRLFTFGDILKQLSSSVK